MIEPAYHYRLQGQLFRLLGGRCGDCDVCWLGKRTHCHDCGSATFESLQFKREGQLASFTLVSNPTTTFARTANRCQGLVQLTDGPTVFVEITDCRFEDLEVGMTGSLVTRKIYEPSGSDMICYGYKFKPNFTEPPFDVQRP